ncbi:MAG: MBL fold metallo-hydrolase [Candidatus Bathyarchaeota archaeon]|nr:MBL fold metallo-hydrolase [Candidatus Bathyarchaeota archaeon]
MAIYVKWLGHASFKIKADEKIIYVDPYEGEYDDKADLVLVSHSHHDHCDPSKIEKIRKDGTLIVAPADCGPRIGGNVKPLEPGERLSVGNITVEAMEAYNYRRFRSSGTPFHPKGLGVGYLLNIGDKTIYYAGDTDFIEEMGNLKDIDLALLPIGGTYTMDIPEAADAAVAIDPRFVMPMHPLDTNPEEFKRIVEGRSEIKVILLNPGEQSELQ